MVFVLAACTFTAAAAAAHAQVQRDRQSPPRDKPAEPTGTGIIAGVVVTADERQQPVRRVSVMLASGQIVTPRTVVTDDAGRFEFTALAPGNYTLVAQKPAWVAAVYGSRGPGDSQGVPIAIANDQRVEGLRLPIMRGGVVSGTVRLPAGQPAADLTIQIMRVQQVDGRRQLSTVAAPAQTNDLGAYRAFGLAPGDYVVQARSMLSIMPGSGTVRQVTNAEVRWADQRLLQSQEATQAAAAVVAAPPEGPTVSYGAVYFPGTSFASDAAVVSVRAGEERGNVDFALSASPTARVTGTVIGTDGAPLGGAVVQLESEESTGGDMFGMMMRMIGGSGRTTTKADGTFVLSGVTSGRYTITARATPRRPGAASASPGDSEMAEVMAMASAMSGMFGGGAENPNTLWASEAVGVNGQDVGPLSLALKEGLKIEGSIVVEGGAAPPDVALLRIGISKPIGGDPGTAMVARALNSSTGLPKEDGSFTVGGLIPGRYQVTVTGKPMRVASLIPGMPAQQSGWVVKSIRWKEQDLADTGIDLQADVPVAGVIVTLTNQPAQLGGTVIDAAGRPTGAFPIVVFATDRAFWAPGSRRVMQAQPASDGKFTVIGLPSGEYYVAAVTRLEPGDLANRQFLEELLPASLRITIRDGEKKTQDLKLSGG
ncbi:MAG TPA: carboxypeptidase-like regulatory domain-containing protein [Vicinamibacterales bacterium]|nr:carboxypeptidase-like regulatory domain-containing protein [Vicinamibacterales bacterium]